MKRVELINPTHKVIAMALKSNIINKTLIKRNTSMTGERIETKIERLMVSKEPIHDTADIIYTERKQGVIPAYDIRTDKMDIAIEAMDKFQKSKMAQRAEYYKKPEDSKPPDKQQNPISPEIVE